MILSDLSSVSILYRFHDIASYLPKFANFNPPHVHLAPTPVCVDPRKILQRSLASENYIPCAIVWHCAI